MPAPLKRRHDLFYVCLFRENGEFFKENNIVSVRRVSFGKHSRSSDGLSSRLADKRFKRFEGLARADNIVNDENTFSVHFFRVVGSEIERLDSLGRDGADVYADRGGHIYFFAFFRPAVLQVRV